MLRGSAFVFRSYSYGPRSEQRRWGRTFAISSVITPVVLGMCVGAVVSGHIGAAMTAMDSGAARFADTYIRPWISPFSIAVGAMTAALLSFLAATYLTIEAAGNRALQDDFRDRALGAAVTAMALAIMALVLGAGSGVIARLIRPGWATLVLAGSGVAAVDLGGSAAPAALSARARRRGRMGDAHPLGLGARAVPANHPARHDDQRRGGTEPRRSWRPWPFSQAARWS